MDNQDWEIITNLLSTNFLLIFLFFSFFFFGGGDGTASLTCTQTNYCQGKCDCYDWYNGDRSWGIDT